MRNKIFSYLLQFFNTLLLKLLFIAQCVLVLVVSLHVAARYALQLQRADAAGPLAYYTHLFFDVSSLQLTFNRPNDNSDIVIIVFIFMRTLSLKL